MDAASQVNEAALLAACLVTWLRDEETIGYRRIFPVPSGEAAPPHGADPSY
jgi:hypothetical protein